MTDSVNKAFVDAEQITTPEELEVVIPSVDLADFENQIDSAVSEVFEFLGRLEADDPEGDQKLANYLARNYGTAFVAGCCYSRQQTPSQLEKSSNEVFVELTSEERLELARGLLGNEGISLRLFG
jgi:hypothetical protein